MKYCNKKGELHRLDGPAIELEDGYKGWYVNGKLHRANDLPAIEWPNGTKMWYVNGKLHRANDLPAIESIHGYKEWYVNGLIHRDNGLPAMTGFIDQDLSQPIIKIRDRVDLFWIQGEFQGPVSQI